MYKMSKMVLQMIQNAISLQKELETFSDVTLIVQGNIIRLN